MTEALPLIQTKLYRPPLQADLVPRPRLLDALNAHWKIRPLTLISAPAGYGKSVLASMWLESCDSPSGWISLDERDNDLGTFIDYLLAAVKRAFPDIYFQSQALLEAPTPLPPPVLARYLINDLDQIEKPFILALDDIHVIHEQAIIDLLTELLKHPPRAMHLVLIGRQDPPIPVASLRAYRLITEIRLNDLRFTPRETAELIEQILRRNIDEDVAAEWTQKTEGWATALHLAALSLVYRQESTGLGTSIQGDSHYLQEYLLVEVLTHIPPVKQTWLLKTSLLDRFCAPLCEAVCQEEGESLTGQAFVSWLQASNLFLTPLDDQGEWFRFHHLFQNHLQNLLERQLGQEEIAVLHQQASRWLAQNGWIDEAIEHALAAGDTAAAVDLMAQHRYQPMNAERTNQLTRLIQLFPDDMVDNDPILAITKAQLPIAYGHEEARLRSRARQLVDDLPNDSPVARMVKGEIAYTDGLWGVLAGPPEWAVTRANDALAMLPVQAQWFRSTAHGLKTISFQMSGDYERSLNFINETLDDPSWPARFRARLFLAQTYSSFFEGDLEAVQQSASKCLKISIKNQLWHTVGEAQYLSGISHYLRNETDVAEPRLSALVDQRVSTIPDFVTHGVCALTRIYQAQQLPEMAREVFGLVFSHLEELGNTFSLEVLRAFQVELALDQGDLTEARRLSQSVDFEMDRPVWYYYVTQLTPIKLMLAEGKAKSLKKAAAALEQLDQQLLAMNRKTHRIDVLALQALVYDAQGDRQLADERLATALRLGQPGGFIRNFLDLGPPMAGLLARLHEQGGTEMEPYISQILAAFQMEEQGRTTQAPVGEPKREGPLTERELQTLRLLATDLTPQEIASKLTITVDTVRTHIKNVYKKLGVHSRFEAVQRANELGFL